ncbi:hypothetical protein E2J91_18180 [Escherichia coli]|nr:hypothetical protein [Escherichia coli]EEW7515184.1 hypothetical protein [Escherichia coli]EEY8304166.1 hypothetical protein [Escherichia coli]EEY8672262.1 hypothetical protein [Escherichia coli]EEY9484414.1 hypothetical protein [Escherichia coli]
MLISFCSRVLQVRFIYAGYTLAIRDNPVSTTQSVATAFSYPPITITDLFHIYDLMCLLSLIYL